MRFAGAPRRIKYSRTARARRSPSSLRPKDMTGSGAIALAVATEVPGAIVHAVELSPAAVAVARRNVAALAPSVHLVEGDAATALPELDAVTVPTLVVQGASDPFGMPPPGKLRDVVTVRGNHSLRTDLGAIGAAVRDWLARVVA